MYAFRLAFKNVVSRKSSIVIIIFIAFAISLLVLSNAVFDGTDNGIENTYVNSFTGNIVIRPKAEFPLSLFGDETPVTGSLSAIPNLVPYSSVKKLLDETSGIEQTIPQISGAAAINIKNKRTTTALFGVDAEKYMQAMTSMQIVEGRAFSKDEKGIMLNQKNFQSIKDNCDHNLKVGDSIQLIMSDGSSFTIRSVPLTGVYTYSVDNDILDRIALVDSSTLRSLMGMVETYEDTSNLDSNETDLLDFDDSFDFDSLFDEESDFTSEETDSFFFNTSDAEVSENSLQVDEDNQLLSDTTLIDENISSFGNAESTAWNFIVCKTSSGASENKIIKELNRKFRANGWDVQAVNWRTAAGSSVYIINYMRIILNVGIILILLTGFIVVNNTLVISALGRIQETGTLRAIGAKRNFIAIQFFVETAILTVSAGILGCILGTVFNQIISSLHISFTNKYLMQLFGGSTLRTVVTSANILKCMGLSLILAVLGWFYPVKVALGTSPVAAMRGQA